MNYFRSYFLSSTLTIVVYCQTANVFIRGKRLAQFGSADQFACRVHYLKLHRSGRVKVICASSRCRNSVETSLVCALHFEMKVRGKIKEKGGEKKRESIKNINVFVPCSKMNKEKIFRTNGTKNRASRA